MAAAQALSDGLRHKLHATARRVRLYRLLQGLSLTVLALAIPGALGLLADHLADGLAPLTRGLFLAGWALLVIGVAVRFLLRPLSQPLDPAALAALVEEHHPELAERLTSSVELADLTDLDHGSPALIALLLEETEKQTRDLPFAAVVSPRRARNLAVTAAIVLAVVAMPAVLWPDQMQGLARRFFLSWSNDRFHLAAVEGDRIAARDRSLTFTARANLEPGQKDDVLPVSATLVLSYDNGHEARLPMLREGPGQFALTLDRLPDGGRYHVEAGAVRSRSHTLTAVVPVELAAESPITTTTPPAYARDLVAPQTTHGLAGVSALQHGSVKLDFRFTRPAVKARLLLVSGSGENHATETLDLPLTDDRRGAVVERRIATEIEYRLVLEAEHGILTEYPTQTLSARLDQAPTFRNFVLAKKDSLPVHPSDRIGFRFDVIDDLAVVKAEIELRVNDLKAKSQFLPIPLTGAGGPEASARHHLLLAGLVQPGDKVYYRFRAQDNRDVPDASPPLTPHAVYHPADDWFSVNVAATAAPLAQRDIKTEHDTLNRKIEQIKADLAKELAQVRQLQEAMRNQRGELTPEQSDRLQDLQHQARTSEENLIDLARDFENTPEMRALTEALRDVARQEVQQAERALQQAEKKPAERGKQLDVSQRELTEAVKRLTDLQKASQQLAKDRLDQMKLEQLAQREQALAERLAQAQQKGESLDPIKQEQAKTAAELQQLVQQNDGLKQALDALRSEQAKELAEMARELAERQKELAEKDAEREQKERIARLAELAKKQEELNKLAQQLAEQTRQAAQVAQKAPLSTEEAKKALESLKQGEAEPALKQQHQAALELDRLAADLDRASRKGQDPKEAAKQLARWQEALKDQLSKEAIKKDADKPLSQRLEGLQRDQKALKEAAEQLALPPNNKEAQEDQKEVSKEAAQAAEALQKQDVDRAARHMDRAREALEKLSRDLPDLAGRQREALAELNRLTRQQEQVGQQAAEAAKQLAEAGDDKQKQQAASQELDRAAKKQASIAEQLGKLDTPGQKADQEKAEGSQQKALADLREGRNRDVPASQEQAKRDLERLKDALEGGQAAKQEQKPAALPSQEQADAARQLAHAQRQLRQALEQMNRPAQGDLAQQQQQLGQQAQQLAQKLGAQQGKPAQEAAQKAQQAAQKLQQGDPKSARGRGEEIARSLEKLGESLTGKPEAAEQAQQLAQKQQGLNQQMQAQTPQQGLQQQTADLASQLQQMARQAPGSAPLQQASQQAQQAQQAMKQAQQQGQQGNSQASQKSQQMAAQSLEQAAQSLRSMQQSQQAMQPTGQPLQQGQQAIQQAQQSLQQGQPQQAQQSMQQAAQSLAQAAQQWSQQQQKGLPNGQPAFQARPLFGSAGGGEVDVNSLPPELRPHAGKSWGELPGELRTRLMQDMQKQYGDDYARRIKLYFEQLADRKKKT